MSNGGNKREDNIKLWEEKAKADKEKEAFTRELDAQIARDRAKTKDHKGIEV